MTQSTSYRNPEFEYTNPENRNRISEMGSQSYPNAAGYRTSQNHVADYDTNTRYNNGYEDERFNNRPEYVDDYSADQRLHQPPVITMMNTGMKTGNNSTLQTMQERNTKANTEHHTNIQTIIETMKENPGKLTMKMIIIAMIMIIMAGQ